MSRTEKIIEVATSFIKNAIIPPTYGSIFQYLEANVSEFSEQDAKFLKSFLPVFYGPSNGLRFYLNQNVDGTLPLDLFLLILEYKGFDTLKIYFGKHRSIGQQMKNIFEQGNQLEVSTHATRDPEHYDYNPFEGVLESKHLTFAVYMNTKLIYCKTKNAVPDVMEVWRLVVNFDTPQEQLDQLKIWSSYVGQFVYEKEFPLTIKIRISDDRPEVQDLVRFWSSEEGFNPDRTEIHMLAPMNRKVFLDFNAKMADKQIEISAPFEIEGSAPSINAGKFMKSFRKGLRLSWDNQRDVQELRKTLLQLFSRLRVRLATQLLQTVIIPEPF